MFDRLDALRLRIDFELREPGQRVSPRVAAHGLRWLQARTTGRPARTAENRTANADPTVAGRNARQPACRRACREPRSKWTARYRMRRSFRGTCERSSDPGRWTSVRAVWAVSPVRAHLTREATRYCATLRLRRYHARTGETCRLNLEHALQVCPQCPSSAPICSLNTTHPIRATRRTQPPFNSQTPSILPITIGRQRTRERHRRIFRSTSISHSATPSVSISIAAVTRSLRKTVHTHVRILIG